MDSSTDLFPSSLPGLDSPQIFDSDMADPMQDTDLFFSSALPQDSPAHLLGDDAIINSSYPSPMPMKVPRLEADSTSAESGHNVPASPESSLQDSSSDSSGRHKRKSSSRSSRSGLATSDITMTDGVQFDGIKHRAIRTSNRPPSFDDLGTNTPSYDTFDLSNRAMENDFDFDSAASSPSPLLSSSGGTYTALRHIAIPYRASPRSAPSLTPHDMHLNRTRETSPLSIISPSKFQHPLLQASYTSQASFNEEYIDSAMLNSMEQLSTWPYDCEGSATTISGIATAPVPAPTESHIATTKPRHVPSKVPTLLLHPTPHKSRVETQIPIKMTLYPMPEGITKLHLPPHTISKPKLLAKPLHTKSPDTLELGTMLVCTSAMQDPAKRRRALNRAAENPLGGKKDDGRRSSSGDASAVDEENQPLNGGEVHICVGCITRERKRAARKKSKKPEEEEPWQRDEAKRIVVFNTTEVKEWQSPSVPNTGDASDEPRQVIPGSTPLLPDDAKQIEVPMRIACYCRHQNERIGFQVIFTIKDYQDNLVAQAMTSPIVITDDHKTHAPPVVPPIGSMHADQAQVPGGMFGREPLENYGPALYRNAHSTTDLQSLRNSYNPQLGSVTMNPFASPVNSSQNTSTTLTPQNRSRQASPSAQSGPIQKKRKASGSARLPDGLVMTRIQGPSGSHGHHPSWTSAASNPTSPAANSPFAPNFPSVDGMPEGIIGTVSNRLPQAFTGPVMTASNDNGGFSAVNRSQSLENLSAVQQMFSAPNSAHVSRAGSPNSAHQSLANSITQPHPISGHNVFGTSHSANPQRLPIIHKLCPTEGSTAGGIEVTCLGSGFCQGLEVMFGDSLATTTTYWSEASLVCLVPPAICAGTVVVTFKHLYQQQLQMARYPSPPVPKQQVLFKYVDDDESELLKHALLLVNQKMTGTIEDAGNIARRIISTYPSGGGGAWSGGPTRGSEHQRQISALQSCLANSMDIEAAVLKCLDLIDLDDSPFQAHLNLRRPNGQSMLHISASLGFHRLVAGLLARGANPDLRDRNGMSPMHMAALHGHSNIVRRLRLAGGDPTLRSLLGFTPADMATSRSVLDAVQALSPTLRSTSAGSRARLYRHGSSATSLKSMWDPMSDIASLGIEDSSSDESEDEESQYSCRSDFDPAAVPTVVQALSRSRHNSNAVKPPFPILNNPPPLSETAGMLSPAAAMTAWRDHLAAQIQHFHQSVNWTLPNLPIPTLPPMPNLPDYQNAAMIRRFSSLVPQRLPRPTGSGPPDTKEGEYRWWELLTGTATSPPPYEEIYPANSQEDLDRKTASAARAAAEAADDEKCSAEFDMPQETTATRSGGSRTKQHREMRSAHEEKVKRLRSDRKLFFIWIPLLLFVVMAMLKDRVPQVWHGAQIALGYVRHQNRGRAVEIF